MSLSRISLRPAVLAAFAAATGFAVLAGAPVAAHNHHHHHHSDTQAAPDIVQTARATGVHQTLVAAVGAAGLVQTLSGPGPFTVFAPTDTGFAKLPGGTVAALQKPENKAMLTNVLTYHAVAGSVSSSDLVALIEQGGGTASIDTLGGQKLTARLSGDAIIITDAKGRATAVTQPDVQTSNGVIHVTDGVFLPG